VTNFVTGKTELGVRPQEQLVRLVHRRSLAVTGGAVTVAAALLAFFSLRTNPRAFAEAVRRADKVVLYEGLPHQLFGKRLLEEERRTKAVVEWGGYPFYQEPLELTARDAERLSEVLGDPQTYQPWKGERLCGGFHPDDAVEWHVGASRYRALICLGCGEFKLSGPWPWSRHDMEKATGEALLELLKGYRKHRPRAKPQE
jgi:hypothetical protein